MRAMVLETARQPLRVVDRPSPPISSPLELRVTVRACGVCRTDVHIFDGELTAPKPSLILGHQIVGRVNAVGSSVTRFGVGDRVGIPWLAWACGECRFCRTERENLCDRARFTGYTVDGGFAEETVADGRFVFPIPESFGDVEAAPLLCAGIIGYRALRMTGPTAGRVGFYGFGSAAHLAVQVARARGQRVYAFTRPGDREGQAFARTLGAVWAGGSDELPPEPLEAALIFAPVGSLVPAALRAVGKGGTVVCAGIHMSDIPSFPYALLWEERAVRSVANLTRADGNEFLPLAANAGVKSTTTTFPLDRAEEALDRLRAGDIEGSAVVVP